MNRRRSREVSTVVMWTGGSAKVAPIEVGSNDTPAAAGREVRAVALAWLSAFLTVSGVTLAASGNGGLALVHLVGVAACLWTIPHASSTRRLGGDLLPLVVAPILYGEIPRLIAAVGSTYHDARVQRWEIALFGGEPSRTFATAVHSLALSELLHAGYLAYYLIIFVPPLLLLVRGKREAYARTVLALTITYTVCWTIYVLFPVQGPRYLWDTGAPNGPVRRLALQILAAGSSRGAAFPSSHMAVSVAQALLAIRYQRRVGIAVAVVAVLVGLGAVYGGFHYGIDILAGLVLGALLVLASWAL